MSFKVLWLSRHEMTEEQRTDLNQLIQSNNDCELGEIVHLNHTFAAKGFEAAEEIATLAQQHEVQVVSGVFPAHVVVHIRLSLDRWIEESPMLVLPVSVPVPAVEGQVRGFRHSHWEVVL
jgi:hypothetical protein